MADSRRGVRVWQTPTFSSQFGTHVNAIPSGIRYHGLRTRREGGEDAPFIRLDQTLT